MTQHDKRARMMAITERRLYPRRRIVTPSGPGRIAGPHTTTSKMLPVDLDAGGRIYVDPMDARLEGWWEYAERVTPTTVLVLLCLVAVALVVLTFLVRLALGLLMWCVGLAALGVVVRAMWVRWRG
jgi:hypothetical protein